MSIFYIENRSSNIPITKFLNPYIFILINLNQSAVSLFSIPLNSQSIFVKH